MEGCFEATARALKPSLRRELATQQLSLDDSWCTTAISGVVACDDFSVDDLLDFSNEEEEEEEEEVGSVEEEDEKDSSSSFSSSSQEYPTVDVDDNNSNSSSAFDGCLHKYFVTIDQFLEPVDEIKELEWVSQVMDDSSSPSEFSVFYPNYTTNRSEPVVKSVKIEPPIFRPSFPSKTRTKRSRPAAGRIWSLDYPVLRDSPASSTSSSPLSSTPCLLFPSPSQNHEWLNSYDEPETKKPKKKSPVQSGGLFQRRCSHCQTQKTPQWRAGPNGPKTLCNACGVRYKSGRLFPEYRPACSPTFSREVHSNSHRKVLEMRRKKELTGPEAAGTGEMIQSF